MAKTSGHGNGLWTRDETILALDLLIACDGQVPSDTDPRVIALSDLLRSLPIHPPEKKKPSFRNPDGVAFKLGNLRAVATGKGLQNVSMMDRVIWKEFKDHPDRAQEIANLIRKDGFALKRFPTIDSPEVVFYEGRIATALHLKRERSGLIRSGLILNRRKAGALQCEGCDTNGSDIPDLEEAIFEAHHLMPLSETGPTNTRLSDMALLCSNCHRLIHRAMANRKGWMGMPEFRALLGTDSLRQKAA